MKKRAFLLTSLSLIFSLGLNVISPVHARTLIPTDFRFFGSGYGHGVGMSQIGARGQALESKTAVEILNYYYPGTAVTAYPDNQLIRVNIANLVSSVTLNAVGSIGEIRLYQGDIPLSESPEPFGIYPGDTTALFTNFAGSVVPALSSPTAKYAAINPAPAWTVRWDSATTTALLTNGATATQYKYGQIVFKSVTNLLSSYLAVTNTLRLHDEYLYGLGEVPSSWPAAALEAQAIAARTYALGKLSRLRVECDCNIYNTTVDQNFVGYAKETEAIYGIKWREAVDRTFVDENNALVVTLEGKPIQAFYFSSSGGVTQNVVDVWGSPLPYLTGVPDPWSLDPTINRRYALWSRFVPQSVMAQAFLLPNVVSFTINSRTQTGSISSITAISSTGATATLNGELFRARVKLPSTWIHNTKAIVKLPFIAKECLPDIVERSNYCLI
ncbi:MAG TPA: SpoIID/LytB domain-containing protein [Candidatus Nanopelagicaceae bacterium]|jgi:SpoIID/LytB domain protein|nr:SpoIID/LytB domain-containing protein [Candidatus Nanopelagicaceae bacterium]